MIDRVGKVAVRLLCAALIVAGSGANAGATCGLNGRIKHVIYVQFDNTHFRRDRPNIPSDLEQMPDLLNFIESKGSLDSNDHTVLISHTATGILASLTGVPTARTRRALRESFCTATTEGSLHTIPCPFT